MDLKERFRKALCIAQRPQAHPVAVASEGLIERALERFAAITAQADQLDLEWAPLLAVHYQNPYEAEAGKRLVKLMTEEGIRTSDEQPEHVADMRRTIHVCVADVVARVARS